MGVPQAMKPWSSLPSLQMTGLSGTMRQKEVLDLACIGWLGKAGLDKLNASSEDRRLVEAQELCYNLFTDVSQNPERKKYTTKMDDDDIDSGVVPCQTTSTILYSHKYDRVCHPLEMMRFQGHSVDLKLPAPAEMRQSQLQELAGSGMTLPCLATVVQALLSTNSLLPPP